MDDILCYLQQTYRPLAILLYGSFQCGTNDEYSDFDCMLVVPEKDRNHDDSVIAGVQLDCFLFTPEEVETGDPDTFLTAYDAVIHTDTDGIAAALQARVRAYAAAHADVGAEERQFIASWIRKTMRRARKGDDEGNYRAVAFLWESLTDYYFLRSMFYFGSKKAIAWLQANDPAGYALFHAAITERTMPAIAAWAEHVTAPVPEQSGGPPCALSV